MQLELSHRNQTLLTQIERDVLDEDVSLATVLRKCLALGGQSGSERLRDWASRELRGYYGEGAELPDYRIIAAPLLIDGATGAGYVKRQRLAPSTLPDFAQEHLKEEVQLRDGVGALEGLLDAPEIKLSPPMAADLVRVMNSEDEVPYQQITDLYWGVAHSAIHGVLDHIRTSLTQLVAELRATTPADVDVPPTEAVDAAMQVIVTGERPQVQISTAHASGPGTKASATGSIDVAGEESGFWTGWRKVGAFAVGVATVVAAIVAVIEAT
jgi:AbiTii